MNQERSCGCKGRRSCLWCEKEYNIIPDFTLSCEMRDKSFVLCTDCNTAFPGWDVNANSHPNHVGEGIIFPGIVVQNDFLSDDEAHQLLVGIDLDNWETSQSGRRKQNYGPKCNFRKRKIVKGDFKGFPEFSTFVHKKLRQNELLEDFIVIEQCSLEYDPAKGASIDPHIDDCWIWGEKIVTVNVLGDSVLTFIPYNGTIDKYNLNFISDNPLADPIEDMVVRVNMPARSLVIMFGDARYSWEHCILREDIKERRVCLAYREFTPPYLPKGEFEEVGKDILDISLRSSRVEELEEVD